MKDTLKWDAREFINSRIAAIEGMLGESLLDNSEEEALINVLTDLRYWAVRHKLDWEQADRTARHRAFAEMRDAGGLE